tara:strand:+ start:13552 stop:14340 length:789 start_codon:yes stop_codon:yes gene_type:complete
MKSILISLIIVFSLKSDQEFKFVAEKKGDYTAVSVDDFGNIYLINSYKNLLKFSTNLDSLYTFESKNLEVDLVAPQHALKILVVDKNLNTALFLDKTLSPTTEEISLNELELPNVEAISMSRDNNVWIFDTDAQELKKFNIQFQQISTSGNLTNIIGENWYPHLLKEKGNKVFLADSTKGIMEFDIYGSYLRTLPFKVKNNFNIIGDNLLCIANDKLLIQDLLLNDQKTITLPIKDIIDFAYTNQHILLLTKEKLHIYQLPL